MVPISPAFQNAVRLVLDEERSVTDVAESLGIYPSSLKNWVRQAKVDRGNGPSGALTTAEKEELAALRKEVRQLKMERDNLKKATKFFAGESG